MNPFRAITAQTTPATVNAIEEGDRILFQSI
jgi:hypothetical protein